jgi:hypothetical protein
MLALSTGRLLKVRLPFSLPKLKKIISFAVGWYARHPLCGAPCPRRLEPPKNTVLLRAARGARRAYTLDNPW